MLRATFGRGWLAVAFGILFLASQIKIATILHGADASHLLFAFQFSFNADAFAGLLQTISPEQRAGLQAHFVYDHIHPLWYGGLIVTLAAWLIKQNQLAGQWDLLILLGVIPSVMDVIENSIHEPLFLGTSLPTDPAVTIAAICATIKWSIALGYLLLAIALGIRAAKRQHEETREQKRTA